MLVFLKLGGSLITDKSRPYQARPRTIKRVLAEIKEAMSLDPELRILLGHGSGSFGHIPAQKYSTRGGVFTSHDWIGFTEVYTDARALDLLLTSHMKHLGIRFTSLPPCMLVTSNLGRPIACDENQWHALVGREKISVIYGDVVFDQSLGGTILSTEELFCMLAPMLRPQKILLAGMDSCVFQDFPHNTIALSRISKEHPLDFAINGSQNIDVTGGMREKVKIMQEICSMLPGMTASIFSGDIPGNIKNSLLGEDLGTIIQ